MQRRTLIILAVFVAGFGAGYGTTWIVVGSPTAAPRAGPALAPAPTNVAAAPDAGGSEGAAPDAGVVLAGTSVPEADAGAVAAGGGATDDAATSVAAASDAAVVPPTEVPDGAGAAAGDPKTPTSLCVNATCRIDFGKVSGGLSVREGHLEDGQVIDWARDFGKAEKLGTIPHGARNKPTRVEVKAIGLADGEPAAAWVVYKGKKGKSLEGIIALRLGDKSVTLVPEPDAAKRDP